MSENQKPERENPLLQEWSTPHGTPPFDQIKVSDFRPAVEEAIRLASAEIEIIAGNSEIPDFENSSVALESAGKLLGRISSVLFNLNSAETSGELQAVVQELSPLLTRYSNDITLNEKLFARIKFVYENRVSLCRDRESQILIEKQYRNFILGGADIPNERRSDFREITEELSVLSVKFEENILEETNLFDLHLTDRSDLSGIPDSIAEMAALEAKSRNKEGWIFTLHFPSYMPFMKYADNRSLREKMHKAYSSRAFHNDRFDNRENSIRISGLRMKLASLLGYTDYASMVLEERMAGTSEKVMSFLKELHRACRPAAERDFNEVFKYAVSNGHTGDLEKWDWAYWSEKLLKEKYEFDDEILRPFFELDKAENAIFDLASELFGISFNQVYDIPIYHPEVKTFEVTDEDGKLLAIFYADYFPRPGKNGGAWMTSYRDQRIEGSSDIRPLISIVANFTRPGPNRPSLLTFNELTTFLHEFGHALHGMLSKCRYETLSGTNVTRDFVELPSQFLENYAYEKEWLSRWSYHYETGEMIPEEIIQKIKASATFNEGYACNRQLGFGFLDMAWHTLKEGPVQDISRFEAEATEETELFPPVEGSNISVSFGHIFGGGYAAGYYGYKWAEVLDADAFSLFRERGIFNRNTSDSFRKNILEKGGTEKPEILFRSFRGREPSIDAFLERSGLRPQKT